MVGTMAKIDDSVKKKVPELRFPGFTDDWEERKLTDVTYSYSGLTYSPTDVQDKGTFVLRSSNVKNDQLIDADNVYVNPDIVNSNNVKVGDVIVVVRNGSRSLIGKHAIVTKEMPHTVIGAFMSAFRGENGDYINALLSTNNFQKEVHKSLGATINQITGKDFSMMNFLTPKLEEQNKIGSFFKQLDNTIALHQRKLDLLKEQKKGYLQKMFPKNGAKVPELRFAGFADDWELRKLGDVVGEIQSGNRLPKDSLTNGDVPYVVAQTKNDGVFTKIARGTLDYNGKPMKLFPGNSISFSIDNPEAMFYRNAEFYTSNIMRVIHEDHLTHEQYVFILENMKRFIRGYDWSRKFSGPVVSNLEYLQPSEEEQQKIGSFFKQLDDTIDLHQRKLDLLKEQKKGYLQKMFV